LRGLLESRIATKPDRKRLSDSAQARLQCLPVAGSSETPISVQLGPVSVDGSAAFDDNSCGAEQASTFARFASGFPLSKSTRIAGRESTSALPVPAPRMVPGQEERRALVDAAPVQEAAHIVAEVLVKRIVKVLRVARVLRLGHAAEMDNLAAPLSGTASQRR
jgi:hypothetical protein